MRDYYRICMDTETIEERSLADLQEILTRLGGWAVVEGEDWEGEEDFLWQELSVRAAQEGFGTSSFISVGQSLVSFVSITLQPHSQVSPPTSRTPRGGSWRWTSSTRSLTEST